MQHRSEYYAEPNITADDAIDLIADGTYDVAMGAYTITAERAEQVSFIHQFHGGGQSILTLRPSEEDVSWMFLKPFHWTLWLAWCVAVVVIAHIIWILEYDTPTFRLVDEDQSSEFSGQSRKLRRMTYSEFLLEGLTISFSSVFYTHEPPRGKHTRVFLLGWQFVILVLVAAYTANMASFLTISGYADSISSDFHDLFDENTCVATVSGGYNALVLEAENVTFIECETAAECVEMLLEEEEEDDDSNSSISNNGDCTPNAFVFDDVIVEYYSNIRHSGDCKLATSGNVFNSFVSAFPTRYNYIPNDVLDEMDIAMIKLWSNGNITEWEIEHIHSLYGNNPCGEVSDTDSDDTTPITVYNMGTMWVFIFGFSILFCVVIICTVERSKDTIEQKIGKIETLINDNVVTLEQMKSTDDDKLYDSGDGDGDATSGPSDGDGDETENDNENNEGNGGGETKTKTNTNNQTISFKQHKESYRREENTEKPDDTDNIVSGRVKLKFSAFCIFTK